MMSRAVGSRRSRPQLSGLAKEDHGLRFWKRSVVSAGISGVLLLASTYARAAGNDQPYPVGELASTMGGAAVAITHDGTAPWYNPAGLGRVTEEGISATLNVYGVQIEKTTGFVGTADLKGWTTAIFPGSLGYVKPLGIFGGDIRHALGIAVVVPDFARHEVALDNTIQQNSTNYELHLREQLLEQTVWVIPGWGACFGPRFCVGASLHVGYWSSTGLYSYFEQYAAGPGDQFADSTMQQTQYSALELAGGAGLQYQPLDNVWIGVSLRSPALTVWSSGKVLMLDSSYDTLATTPDASYVRRASDDNLKIDQRLPLRLRLGVGVELGDWLLAADVNVSLPQSQYQAVRTHDGQTTIQPMDAEGNPVSPNNPLDIGQPDGRNTIVNVNVGAQYHFSKKLAAQAGFFTDFSGQPDDLIDELINHYGLTAGIAMKGASSMTFVGVIATLGIGKSYGVSIDPGTGEFLDRTADAQSEAIYFTLGGSTRLGDPPEKPLANTAEPSESAPPVPEVAPHEQRDPQAAPSPPPEEDQSAKSSHAKKKVKKARRKDSE